MLAGMGLWWLLGGVYGGCIQQGSGRSMLADIAVRVRARLGDLGFCGCFVSKLVFWLAWGPGSWLVYHRSCVWVHAMGPGTDVGPLVHL